MLYVWLQWVVWEELRKNSIGCDFSDCSGCQCKMPVEGDKDFGSQFNVELMEPAAAVLCWSTLR